MRGVLFEQGTGVKSAWVAAHGSGLEVACAPVPIMNTESEESVLALQRQLRWQCRRGMKELDFLLVRYLDAHFCSASAIERENFLRLLKVEDDLLWAWFLGRSHPEDSELDALVQRIRGTS